MHINETGLSDSRIYTHPRACQIKSSEVNIFDKQYIQACTVVKGEDPFENGYTIPETNSAIEDVLEMIHSVEDYSFDESDIEVIENTPIDELNSVLCVSEYRAGITRGISACKLNAIQKEPDSMYLSALTSKEPITVNSLYKGCFSGDSSNEIKLADKELERILNLNSIKSTENNKWAAQKLINIGVDVSQTNISKIQNIKAAVDTMHLQDEIQDTTEENLGVDDNEPIIKDDTLLYSENDIEDIVSDLEELTSEDLKEVVKIKDISINSIRKVMIKNTQKVKSTEEDVDLPNESVADIEEIKSQIETIKLKLTVESAQKLSNKISIEFSPIMVVANELNNLELGQIQETLDRENISNIDALEVQKVTTAVQKIAHSMHAIPLDVEAPSIESLEFGIEQYLANETKPTLAFKEGYNKVSDQVEGLLVELGIEPTELNIDAAKALITNKVEVDAKNIEGVALLLAKLEVFIEEMTPNRIISFISEGVNPYTSSVDNLLNRISEEMYPKMQGSLAETIYEVNKTATDTQKEGLIGLYKILDHVNRNKEQVAGYVYKKGGMLSVSKFEEALKSMGKQISLSVDDSTGELKDLINSEKQVSYKVEETLKEAVIIKNNLSAIENTIITTLEDLPMGDLESIKAQLYAMVKRLCKQELSKMELSDMNNSIKEKVAYIKDTPIEVIKEMIEKNVPLTIFNLYWGRKNYENNSTIGDLLKNVPTNEEFPKTVNELEHNEQKLREAISEQLHEATMTDDVSKYKAYKEIQEFALYQKEVLSNEEVYNIPFVINGEQRNVHLYIDKRANAKNGEGNITYATIRYETKHLGLITTTIKLEDKSLSYEMTTTLKEVTRALNESSNELKNELDKQGYAVENSKYVTEERSKDKVKSKYGESNFEEII